jgi:hypothetical protein
MGKRPLNDYSDATNEVYMDNVVVPYQEGDLSSAGTER